MTPRSYVDALFDELAAILAALHAWTPPPEIATLMHDRPQLDLADPLSVWAADLVALPIPRALAVSDLVRALAHVDPALVDAAVERIRSLAGADALATPREPWVVVHGDAVIGNVLVHGTRNSALLDFEWARLGPPDLELVSLVRMAQGLPFPLLAWLQEDYPRLFAAPDLERRLWLYELGYMLRGVIWWPPERPEGELTPKHLIHILRALIDAPLPR
jgi:Phosphotransferase enzyme family